MQTQAVLQCMLLWLVGFLQSVSPAIVTLSCHGSLAQLKLLVTDQCPARAWM